MAFIEFEERSVQGISDLPNYERFFGDAGLSSKVNRSNATKLAAVVSCQDAISSDLAGIPIQLKKKTGNKVDNITTHSTYDKLKSSPNPDMNAFILRQTRGVNSLSHGNGYIFVERSILNPVKNLWLLDPDSVDVVRTRTKNGRRGIIQYVVEDGFKKRTYSSKDILHLKGPSWNGLVGESIITSKARDVLGIGLDMDQFLANFFKNGMNPGGIFTHPETFGENKESFIAALKKRFQGNNKSRLPMALENNVTYQPFDVKMVDQQFLEMMKLNKVDICGMYGVPPSRISISDSNTNYNNSEQEARLYVRSGLLKWAIQDEQEMNLKLLTEQERKSGLYFKYNFNALLRGDSETRANNHHKYWQMGKPLNRILELEDENPVDGGDDGRVQMNTISLKEADQIQANEAKEGESNRSFDNDPEYRTVSKTIAHRKRVQARFSPLIRDAAQKLVNREALAIKKESKKQSGERSASDMRTWLDNFYSDFGKYIDKDLSPLLRAYAESIQEAVAGEVGADIGLSDELEIEINNYIDGFKTQYTGSSRGQMIGQLEIGLEALDIRADEWHERRAVKVSDAESNGMSNMVASFVIAGAGLSPTWRTVGKSCVFCNQMNGKKVRGYGVPFLNNGTTLKGGEGDAPMTVRTTLYPPLHIKCDCVISAR